jgi:hypothetical protein
MMTRLVDIDDETYEGMTQLEKDAIPYECDRCKKTFPWIQIAWDKQNAFFYDLFHGKIISKPYFLIIDHFCEECISKMTPHLYALYDISLLISEVRKLERTIREKRKN